MSWDSRGYYYRSIWNGGRPRRVYVGGGLIGDLAAQEQEQRAAQDAQRRLQRHQDREVHRAIDAQYQHLRGLVAALLTAAGFYQHKREWRKMGKQLTGPALQDKVHAGMEELVQRMNKPNPSRVDLDALKAILAEQAGSGATISALDGDVILGAMIDKYTDSAASRLVMRNDALRLAKTLGLDAAPAFERPLIDHIVTCWLRLQLVERDMTNNTAGSHSRESGVYWDRRLTEAQRRYLRAMNLLAKLRHFGPAVQVNVAHQQIVQNQTRGME